MKHTEILHREGSIGGSISGDPFSTIPGDLITELFNKETKGTGGPFRAGFSTNIEAVNKWVRTIHIHAKLRKMVRTTLHIKSSSKHKEVTNRGRKLHHQHVTHACNKSQEDSGWVWNKSFFSQFSKMH